MEKGLKHTSTVTVDEHNIAAAMGSGGLRVFATPAMVALMENAAMSAVAGSLPEGSTTVGTLVNIVHARATPIGDTVSATAVLQETDGRRLLFHVTASDNCGVIGEGVHERFIVDTARFMDKVNRVR